MFVAGAGAGDAVQFVQASRAGGGAVADVGPDQLAEARLQEAVMNGVEFVEQRSHTEALRRGEPSPDVVQVLVGEDVDWMSGVPDVDVTVLVGASDVAGRWLTKSARKPPADLQ